MDGKHCRTTSGVECHHRLWAAHTVERRQAWHAIIAFELADPVGKRHAWHAIIALGRQTWSNNVGIGMTSPPLDSTHGQTTSGMTCHHLLWTTHTVERRRAWNAIIAFGKHTRSSDVGCGMPSPPFDRKCSRTTLGVACHHRLWAAQTFEQFRAWHAIIAFGLAHTVGRHRAWHAIIALGWKHGRTTSGVACNHSLWAVHMVQRCRAWHDITAFGQRIRSNNVERSMPSPFWDITDGQTTSGVACYHRLWAAQTVGRHRV